MPARSDDFFFVNDGILGLANRRPPSEDFPYVAGGMVVYTNIRRVSSIPTGLLPAYMGLVSFQWRSGRSACVFLQGVALLLLYNKKQVSL